MVKLAEGKFEIHGKKKGGGGGGKLVAAFAIVAFIVIVANNDSSDNDNSSSYRPSTTTTTSAPPKVVLNGYGQQTYDDGASYKGNLKNGLRHGQGIMTWPNGDKYKGEFSDGYRHGQGTYAWFSGEKSEGVWKYGEQDGAFLVTWPNGKKFDATYDNGELTLFLPQGTKYHGDLKDGKPHGYGEWLDLDGYKYEGEFKDGKLNGFAIRVDASGHELAAQWMNGRVNWGYTDLSSTGYKSASEKAKRMEVGVKTRDELVAGVSRARKADIMYWVESTATHSDFGSDGTLDFSEMESIHYRIASKVRNGLLSEVQVARMWVDMYDIVDNLPDNSSDKLEASNGNTRKFLNKYSAERQKYIGIVKADDEKEAKVIEAAAKLKAQEAATKLKDQEDKAAKEAAAKLKAQVELAKLRAQEAKAVKEAMITAESTAEIKAEFLHYANEKQRRLGTVDGATDNGLIYRNGSFDGEIIGLKKNGYGTREWDNGDAYTGYWKNNKRYGKGIFTWADGREEEQEYDHGKLVMKHAYHRSDSYITNVNNPMQQMLTFSNGVYVGEVKNGKRHGQGVMIWSLNGDKYVGQWKNGVRHGDGIMTSYYASDSFESRRSVAVYVGQWKDGLQHGLGRYEVGMGVYDGGFARGERHGMGTLTKNFRSGKEKLVARWVDGDLPSYGTYIHANGDEYVGELELHTPHGYGTLTKANGDEYVGQWKDGCFKENKRWAVFNTTPKVCGFEPN